MNIHLAQSIQARNELKRIANVQYQIVGVKDSSPIIGCQQDTLSGAYMLTEPDVKMKGWEIANMLCNTTSETKYDIKMDKEYTGHEIFSYIIPEGINNTKKSGDKITFQIIDGKLTIGHLDKSSLSFAKNSIIHFIWDKWGPSKTRRFIDDSQRLVLHYLLSRGQTVGFEDILVDKEMGEKINQVVNNAILKCKYDITQYENDIEQLPPDIIEDGLKSDLSVIQSSVGMILMNHFNIKNFFWASAKSGAKGASTNVAQVNGIIAQNNVEGVRIKKRIEGRSLIYFHRDDDTPEARGFIKSSYLTGLKGFEFCYNAMAGREGLIDTAIRTASTGYIQRQLIKGLEDLMINYDGTNRNARGVVVQIVYGENGINQSTQTEVKLDIITLNNEELKSKLGFSAEQIKKLEKSTKMSNKELTEYNNKFIKKVMNMRDELRDIQARASCDYKVMKEMYVLPINLLRITQFYSHRKENLELKPQEIEDYIEEFLSNYDNRIITLLKPGDKFMKKDDRYLKFLLETALYDYLAPVKCIFEYGLSKEDLKNMMAEIKLSFIKSIIEPGEMVGELAAQSIGEPTSQMTLNTKHSAGAAKKTNTTSGVPRIQELLHYSKNIKTPQMIIYFQEPYATDRSLLNKVASNFKYLNIRQLFSSVEVYYDVGANDRLSKEIKSDNVSMPFYINNQKVDVNTLPFVFRIKMNIEKMLDKETSLLDIKTKFVSYWYKNYTNIKNLKKTDKEVISRISRCAILSNTPSEKEQVIHVRFSMSSFSYNIITDFLKMVLDDVTLKGIENIDNIDIVPERKVSFDSKTGDIIDGKEFVIYTSGINYEKLTQIKGVDFTRTRTNDIATVLRLYGIEATRQMLMYELTTTYSESGANININHLSLLVDQMCHMGEITSMDRHGLSKIDIDPIARASFEKTMDHFINAAIFNEKDSLKSVSSRIALGKVIGGGTGSFELLLDTKKIENSEYTENETGGRITFTPLEEEPLLLDIMKNEGGELSFYNPLG